MSKLSVLWFERFVERLGYLKNVRLILYFSITFLKASKEKERALLAARKLQEQRKKDEVASLFTSIDIIQAKVPFGVGKF